jgi:N-acetylglucosamine-6-phosphate deacetylase
MSLCIRNASLITPETRLEGAALRLEGGLIAALGPAGEMDCPPGADVLDAAGLLVAPGFIDLQINGGFGCDFTTDPGSIWEVGAALPRYGVTSFLPTIITAPLEVSAAGRAVLHRGAPAGFKGARPLGLHLEGPFLNPGRRGAHNPQHLRLPLEQDLQGWSRENGVALVTLAPELPGGLEATRLLAERGVVVSAGHSLATWDEAHAAFAAGVTCGTHLFNVMPPIDHRNPGLAAALLTHPAVHFGMIADGVHLHPGIVRMAWQAAGPERPFLVSDAMAALGMPPGTYELGELAVTVDGVSARLADGRLAGSLLTLDQAVRNLLAWTDCTLQQALAAASLNPARALGLDDQYGRIAAGLCADLVLLTPDLRVAATLVGGEICHTSELFAPERYSHGTA